MSKKPNYCILVIEDDWKSWKPILEKIFHKGEYELKFSEDGQQYTNKIDITNYSEIDLILCDHFIKMSKSNETGVDWVKNVLKPRDPYLPVIFWTSSMDPEIIQKTAVGEYVFMKKKLDVKLLKEKADELIRLRKNKKQYPLYNEYFDAKISDEEYRELGHRAYVNASKYLESFFAHSKFHAVFNTHGLVHKQNVLLNLSKLLYHCDEYFASDKDYQNFLILGYIATLFHDLGMIPLEYIEEVEFTDFKESRKQHNKTIFGWIIDKTIDDLLDIKFDDYFDDTKRYMLATLCLYHDSHYEFKDLYNTYVIEELKKWNKELVAGLNGDIIKNIQKDNKLKVLSSLIALADKLDYNPSRVPISVLRESPFRGMRDEFEYIKNDCLKKYEIQCSPNATTIFFYVVGYNEKLGNIVDPFKEFEEEIVSNKGEITKKAIELAAYDLVNNVFTDSFVKMNNLWNNCVIKVPFLKNLVYKFECDKSNISSENRKIFDVDWDGKLDVNNKKELNFNEISLLKHIMKMNSFCNMNLKFINVGFSGEKSYVAKCEKELPNGIIYKTQDKFIKIGKYQNIHNEVNNYKNYIIPFIDSLSLIGAIDEYKFIDEGAMVGSFVKHNKKESKTIDYIIISPVKLKDIINHINNTLEVFYSKIQPTLSQEGGCKVLDYYKNMVEKINEAVNIIGEVKDQYKPEEVERIGDVKKIYEKDADNPDKSITGRYLNVLEKLNKTPLSLSVIHGDFTFRNVLLDSENTSVFIDFAETRLGHFFMDFAKLDNYLRFEKTFPENFSLDIVEIEEKIDVKNHNQDNYIENAKGISAAIWEKCSTIIKKSYPNNECLFDIERNLARLFVNYWSLVYTKKFDIRPGDRIKIIEHYIDKLEEEIQKKK